MQIQRRRFLRVFWMNWRKCGSEILTRTSCDNRQWSLLRCKDDEAYTIPEDVPKGHMVVYVGEECKRFVIRVTLLNHPLFRQLLDQAQDVYEFSPNAKLCIPCDESIFRAILCYAGSQQGRRYMQSILDCFCEFKRKCKTN